METGRHVVVACLGIAALWVGGGCGDDPPAPRRPHLELSTEATAGLVKSGSSTPLAMRVRVAAGRLGDEARQPLNLVLVLDTSGSMAGDAIAATRAAAQRLVERLSPGDRLAIVAFDSTARVIVPSATVGASMRRKAIQKIRELEARGTTDLAAGLALGLEESARGRRANTIDRIVVSGDGVPNDATAMPSLVERARQTRVTITALGLGVDYDEDLLGRLAMDTGGAFHFVADAQAVSKVFDEELVRMKQVVARNVRVTVRPGPGVALEALPGLEAIGPTRVAWMGDLAAGEVRDVIVPLTVLARRDGANVELADVEVTYDDVVGPRKVETLRGYVAATAASDDAKIAASVKLPLEAARRRAAAASAILEAIRRARSGDVAGGLALLDASEKETRAAAQSLGDAELTALADRMAELRRNLAQVAVAFYEDANTRGAGGGEASPAAATPVANQPAPAEAETRLHEPKLATKNRGPARAPDNAEQTIRSMHDEASRQLSGH